MVADTEKQSLMKFALGAKKNSLRTKINVPTMVRLNCGQISGLSPKEKAPSTSRTVCLKALIFSLT
jgi:hypothetical protein